MDLKKTEAESLSHAAISREVSLRLAASPQTINEILAAPVLADGIVFTQADRFLEAAYYDTADFLLQQRGVSLCVRKEGARYVQAVAADGGAPEGRGDREWQMVVSDFTPHPDWVMDADARAHLGHLAPDELSEIFRVRLNRKTHVVGYEYRGTTALIEAAFNRGALETGADKAAVSEIELELLKGSKAALFALALELNALAPLHIDRRSIAARGYALSSGRPPGWRKAGRLEFPPQATVDDAMAVVFRGCLNHWLANEPAVLAGGQPEGLHQMRVALRRLRSGLMIFGAVLPMMQAGWLKRETKWIANILGAARDWDVFLDEVLAPLESARVDDPALAALRDRCEQARGRSYEVARNAICSARYTTFVLNFCQWLEDETWRDTKNAARREILAAPLDALAQTLLDRQYSKVIKLGRNLAAAPPAKRHKLRIAIKKLRYSAEFFASLYGRKKPQRLIARLSRLQDTLGDLNDLAMSERRLDALIDQAGGHPTHDDVVKGVGLVIGWCAARAEHGDAALLQQWDRVAGLKPFWRRARKR